MKHISLQALVRSLREEVDLPGDQEKIDVAEPKGKITAADFKKLRSMNEKVDMEYLGFELNLLKKQNPGKKVTYSFVKDPKYPKGYVFFIDGKLVRESIKEGGDHEVAMAMSSLKEIVSNATQLMHKLGNMERNIPGWIQDHITNAENYIEQANQGFHEIE